MKYFNIGFDHVQLFTLTMLKLNKRYVETRNTKFGNIEFRMLSGELVIFSVATSSWRLRGSAGGARQRHDGPAATVWCSQQVVARVRATGRRWHGATGAGKQRWAGEGEGRNQGWRRRGARRMSRSDARRRRHNGQGTSGV